MSQLCIVYVVLTFTISSCPVLFIASGSIPKSRENGEYFVCKHVALFKRPED